MSPSAPYGSWPSIVTPREVVAGASAPTSVAACDGVVWWSETRPEESGRETIVRLDPDGTALEILPADWNVRTRVHEYGGGAWWVHGETVFATRWDDQRLYRLDPGGAPVAITPEPPEPHAWRYADGHVTPDGAWSVCVRERHEGPDVATQVHNEIVAVPTDGSGPPVVLFSGSDFVAAPRISRDGRQLAWLVWNHPNMPWDDTELWVGRLDPAHGLLQLLDARREAGVRGESLIEPQWGRHATLYVCSDRSDWWNVARVEGVDRLSPMVAVQAEIGGPSWWFGESHYVVTRDGTVVSAHIDDLDTVLTVVPEDGPARTRRLAHQHVRKLVHDGDRLVGIVTYPDRPPEVRDLTTDTSSVLRPGTGRELPPDWVSVPHRVEFPTPTGQVATAWCYAPRNPDVTGEPGTRPPLLVAVHGGPTGAAASSFSLATQFWTSRGFAVVDVDYRGSTGYGRAFRELLREQWGVVDVEDACAAAEHVAIEGLADADRMVIRGGSAGGTTTLLAVFLHDTFAAGTSYFGVTDIRGLLESTHKFESRYFDSIVGPWPQEASRYEQRSPITHVRRCRTPMLILQGLEDAVVPPEQAQAIVSALDELGIPHAYLPFEGEQHGFRKAENQIRALEAELSVLRPSPRLRPRRGTRTPGHRAHSREPVATISTSISPSIGGQAPEERGSVGHVHHQADTLEGVIGDVVGAVVPTSEHGPQVAGVPTPVPRGVGAGAEDAR